jgi:hypothetical protein
MTPFQVTISEKAESRVNLSSPISGYVDSSLDQIFREDKKFDDAQERKDWDSRCQAQGDND